MVLREQPAAIHLMYCGNVVMELKQQQKSTMI